jgi:hypothetical protein
MSRNNFLIIDEGDSILVNLTHAMDGRDVAIDDEPIVFSARNVQEAQKLLIKYGIDQKWKIIVIGRESGIEPKAQAIVDELSAKFDPNHPIPMLLVTKTSAAFEPALRGNVRGKSEVARVAPDVNFDLADEEHITKAAEAKFDHVIDITLKNWLMNSPESAGAYPITPPPKSESRGVFGLSG